MKAFCIFLPDSEYSRTAATRCVASARQFGVDVMPWPGIGPEQVNEYLAAHRLRWTWANDNTSPSVCKITGLKQHPYKSADQRMRIGCSLSHYLLWKRCVMMEQPIVILEHDAIFIRELPKDLRVESAVMLNDPTDATPRGSWWAAEIARKGAGVHSKTIVFADGRPDGLAGNSAYAIAPWAAAACIESMQRLGVWPNDATLCRQLIAGLAEIYPFVTKVHAEKSMAGGY